MIILIFLLALRQAQYDEKKELRFVVEFPERAINARVGMAVRAVGKLD